MRYYWRYAGRSNMQGVEYARRIRGMVWQSDGILKGQWSGVLRIGASEFIVGDGSVNCDGSVNAGRFRIDGVVVLEYAKGFSRVIGAVILE